MTCSRLTFDRLTRFFPAEIITDIPLSQKSRQATKFSSDLARQLARYRGRPE
jgi:hypothetical protein